MILGFKEKFADGAPTNFKDKILGDIKLHSFRTGNRWKKGNSIQMATGVRTANYKCFNSKRPDLQTCKSVQQVEITYYPAVGKMVMIIDGKWMTEGMINFIVKADGLTYGRFIQWFFPKGATEWKGQLIHWTNLSY